MHLHSSCVSSRDNKRLQTLVGCVEKIQATTPEGSYPRETHGNSETDSEAGSQTVENLKLNLRLAHNLRMEMK